MALIFISHDLSVVTNVSDKLIFMKNARIIEKGNTKKILRSPKHKYTKTLLASFENLGSKRFQEKHKPSMSGCETLVKVCDLSKSYKMSEGLLKKSRIIHAVRRISLEVSAGETLAIVGESGSGKTTLARELQLTFREPYLRFGTDTVHSMLPSRFAGGKKTQNEHIVRTAVLGMNSCAATFADAGNNVIVDTVMLNRESVAECAHTLARSKAGALEHQP